MNKIIFFGAGTYAEDCWKQIEKNSDCYDDDYLVFCDNDAKLWGNCFCGKKIISPQDINKYNADLIVITSVYHKQIFKQLVEKYYIAASGICTFEEYKGRQFAKWAYKKQYGNQDVQINERNKTSKLVVYTAVTKNYDILREPAFIHDNITYVCFTDDPTLRSKVWNIEYVKNTERNNVLYARNIKMQPHIYFPDFEISVWVDGKFSINNDLREYVDLYQKNSVMLCFPHYERQCIYDEMAACLYFQKGSKENIMRQSMHYYQMKYPLNNGLYETGCLVRKHNDDECKTIMHKWLQEIYKYTVRDQISLPYVCWKNNFKPDICDLYICNNKWLTLFRHN